MIMPIEAAGPEPDTAWIATWLQCNDTFYPTGTYAHSFGLEGAVQEGLVGDLASFRSFLRAAVLPPLAGLELPLTAHAYRALQAEDWNQFDHVRYLASAMKTAREPREATEGIGRQRLSLLATLHPHPLIREAGRRIGPGGAFAACVATALETRVLGAPIEAALASVCYGTVSSLAAAAMKLLRLGQNGIQQTMTATLASAPQLIAAGLATPLDAIGWSNPWWDIAAARHELADGRMFIS